MFEGCYHNYDTGSPVIFDRDIQLVDNALISLKKKTGKLRNGNDYFNNAHSSSVCHAHYTRWFKATNYSVELNENLTNGNQYNFVSVAWIDLSYSADFDSGRNEYC